MTRTGRELFSCSLSEFLKHFISKKKTISLISEHLTTTKSNVTFIGFLVFGNRNFIALKFPPQKDFEVPQLRSLTDIISIGIKMYICLLQAQSAADSRVNIRNRRHTIIYLIYQVTNLGQSAKILESSVQSIIVFLGIALVLFLFSKNFLSLALYIKAF